MANSTFIQIPLDVTNPMELRRFLDKLVQQLDVAFGNRGEGGFALDTTLVEVIGILNNHEIRLDSIESTLPGLVSDVQDLKDGELILSITSDVVLGTITETILCDCSSNSIEVKLPDPSTVFSSGSRSKTISISKIDNSRNKVIIVPFNTELIVTENNVALLHQSEVINLITNGTDWYLGA